MMKETAKYEQAKLPNSTSKHQIVHSNIHYNKISKKTTKSVQLERWKLAKRFLTYSIHFTLKENMCD